MLEVFLCGEAGADEAGVGVAGGVDDFGVGGLVFWVAVVPVAAAVGDGVGEVLDFGA